jgi:hypothetical protein
VKKTQDYTQCDLVRRLGRGTAHQTSWIPSRFAQVGKALRLRSADGWQDGWVVSAAYRTLPEEVVLAMERQYLRQRRASDV